MSYDDDVHPYSDLRLGRVDAVLLDNVLADRAMRRQPGLVTQPEAVATGYYVVLMAPEQTALRDQVNDGLRAAMARRPARSDLPQVARVERRPAPRCMRAVLAGADSLLGDGGPGAGAGGPTRGR